MSTTAEPKWRLHFHDTYTGEGGDMGIVCATADEARQAAQREWTDVVRDLSSSLYKQRVLAWDPSRTVATARYDVARGFTETVTYRLVPVPVVADA